MRVEGAYEVFRNSRIYGYDKPTDTIRHIVNDYSAAFYPPPLPQSPFPCFSFTPASNLVFFVL